MFFGNNKTPDHGNTALPANGSAAAQVIFDVGTDTFEEMVLKTSMSKPVIVDFWAPWCGPCKQLTPVLESAVKAAGGAVILAKINMDENQDLAAMLRIQSIPTVYAFFGGRPVDAFQGNQPESAIKDFVYKLAQIARQAEPDALDIPAALDGAAQALADGETQAAQAIYMQILQQDPHNAKAFAGMVRALIAMGQNAHAEQFMTQASEEIKKDPSYKEAQSALELAKAAPQGSEAEFMQKLAADANDHQARFDLANLQFAQGKRADAIENLLMIVERNRGWKEEAARLQLLKFFEAMGHTDPLTLESRRKLSSLLFS